MFRRPIFWIVAVLLCAVGAWCLWQRGNRPIAQTPVQTAASANKPSTPPALVSTNAPAVRSTASLKERLERARLSNTTEPLNALLRRDSALVLENARWDTTKPLDLNIPAHLRAQGDPGTYIVKASGHIDNQFRELLRRAGLSLISYIPHDAWLVRGSEAQVATVNGQPGVQAVIPFEPYFKLKSALLPMAIEQEAIPAGTYLNLVLFADGHADTLRALADLDANILAEGPSPFGPVVTVQARPNSLVALAQLPGVQIIERSGRRVLANDLTRVTMGISTDTVTTNNYFGLTGSNVLVAITDSDVDMTHPDLTGRVLLDAVASGIDFDGHGTHVAGIIAGDGTSSGLVGTNALGSVAGASFRGKAPGAKLYSTRLGATNSAFADLAFPSYVQQQIGRTNALISNNSWGEGGVYDYDILAASYDAAVRDTLPFEPGSQAVTFVFSAGNDGGAADNGLDGFAGSVLSPSSAKNVITVGALEQLRNITNEVRFAFPDETGGTFYITNQPWAGETDSANEVAAYSSRGNVGIGVEGEFGRYKPDVVAPGSMVISARSGQWDEAAYYSTTNTQRFTFSDQVVAIGELNQYSVFVPPQSIGFQISVAATDPPGLTNLPIYVRVEDSPSSNLFDGFATNVIAIPPGPPLFTPGSGYFFAVGNPYGTNVTFNLTVDVTVTNNFEDYYRVLKQMNNALGGRYRYESGTSMAAPAVSGFLALMQEFYAQRMNRTNSPALMKALLINGARSASSVYDLQVNNPINHQGWGLPNLPTSLPPSTNALATNNTSFTFYDQSPTNALATGQSVTRSLTLNNNSQTRPLRVTLVWTDPPGNPAAGVKLVNDLDLVVTNLDTKEVYFGNDIAANNDFNSIAESNAPPVLDLVNNVENVFISEPFGTNFTITVRGRRVNVNAVTANTNDVVQDYALVISSGNGEVTNSFSVADAPIVTNTMPFVTFVTNTATTPPLPLFNQTVGANAALLSGLNGMTNQWHFYVVTNYGTNANFTNGAFITFLPSTLATPRMGVRATVDDEHSRPEADIDMYVSRDASLTNLNPAAIAGAARSVGRGGTETIVIPGVLSNTPPGEIIISNTAPGDVFYVGIKSEDQMAGQYAFFSIFSDEPFSSKDKDGNLFLRGFPVPTVIPDGTPSKPGTAFIFGIAVEQIKTRRVIVTNIMTHENFGDLLGNLSHNRAFAVLHNHTFGNGLLKQEFVYDDSDQADLPGSKKSDGPGSLQNFVGEEGIGQWMLTMLDDSPTSTGSVDRLTIKIEPELILDGGDVFTLQPGGIFDAFVDVPVGATNLMIGLTWEPTSPSPMPVDLFVRRGARPNFVTYDKKTTVFPPGGTNVLSITKADLPPLQPGTYYIRVFNPNAVAQILRLTAHIDIDLNGIVPDVFASTNAIPILDDAVTYDQILVTNKHKVITAEVGVRVNHERVSDLALQLQSPTGRRVMLFENRGGNNPDGLGSDIFATNNFNFASSGGPAETNFVINTGSTEGTIRINYEFFNVPDTITVYYQSAVLYSNLLANAGHLDIHYGPGASQLINIVMNQGGNTNLGTAWNFSVTTRPIGYRDLIFTEYTNKVSQPKDLLKFVLPPFTSGAAGATLLASGFETAAAGSYANPAIVEGWSVFDTNEVGVLADAANAYVGNQFLALADGHITRSIPTLPGRDYLLQYAYRGPGIVGWWRGEGNGSDAIGGNTAITNNGAGYGPGEVGQAFTFDGVDDLVMVPASPALDVGAGPGLTIDLWAYPEKDTIAPILEWNNGSGNAATFGVHMWQGVDISAPGDGLGNYNFNLQDTTGAPHGIFTPAGYVLTNVYQHLALTYDKASGVAVLYVNGVAVVTQNFGTITPRTFDNLYFGNRASGPFSTDHYKGRLDEVSIYNRAASAAEIKAIYLRGVNGKFDTNAAPPLNLAKATVAAGPYTNTFFGDVAWQTQSTVVRAPGNALAIDFQGLAPGMLLDEIKVTEQPTNLFVLPEEPLTALKGDKALGNWKLEMWDSRVGASNPVPELLEWNLSFIFEQETPPFFLLEPFVKFTNSIPPGSFHYLLVDVPAWANVASNYLLNADLPLFVWFNQNGAPTGSPADTALMGPAPITNGVGVIITNGAPPLLPGKRYYIGLQNTNATAVNYGFQVDFDITALTNAVPYDAVTTSNSIPRYFSYDVSAAATAVQFDLFNLTGDLHLIARQGAPLPTLYGTGFDYGSFNFGLNDEQILVFTNSKPVALKPGVWYLGVINATALPANYSIMATEFTNVFPNIITLTNAIPYANSNLTAAGTAQYYRYVVTTNAVRVQFETFGADGDFTLVAHKGLPLPDLATFDFSSANPGTNDEVIVITTNSAPVTLTFGDWFITAVKISGGAANYSIMATEWAVTGHPIIITDFNISGGDFCITWNSLPGAHYVVQSTPVFAPPVWTNALPTITAVDFSTTWCTPITGTMSYFQVIEGIGSSAVSPVVGSVNITSVQYTPGSIVLTWSAPPGSSFHVEWTDSLALPITWNTAGGGPITSGTGTFTFTDTGLPNTAPLGPVRFYRLVQP